MRIFFIFSFWALGIMSLFAQHNLQSCYNMFRAGDEIVKQQVEYKDPGRSGENVLWDFSKLNIENEEYQLQYSSLNDSVIIGTEHHTRYYYSLSDDSLLCHGYENATTIMTDSRPELLMKFPVHYRDSTFCYYNGDGKYCNRLKISAMGTISAKADAFGMMILPGGDTLKNVIRVRTCKHIAEKTQPMYQPGPLWIQDEDIEQTPGVSTDSIDYRLANDTVLLELETYRWYTKAYRYPVFETIKSITNRQGQEREFFNTAFFYPPQEHYYLDDDEENLALLEEEKGSEEDTEIDNPQNNNPWLGLTYNFYPNPVETILEIEVYMPKQGEVRMQLIDRMGKPVWNEKFGTWETGINATQIFMSPFVRGAYVLNMWFDDYMIGEIILKQ